MGKIKIGIGILTAITLVGLVLGLVVFANPSNGRGSNNGKAEYVSDEIIVKFKGDTEPFRVIKVPKGKVIEKVKAYQQRPEVEYAEPNYLMFALGSDDPYYSNQWALNNTGQEIFNAKGEPLGSGTADADVDWDEAWTDFNGTSFSETIVAVVDSGIDENHPDLDGKLVAGYDFVNDDNDPHDIYGHGTHVSGIAAAETNNLEGIAGTAFSDSIKIMPIQVLDDDGMGSASNVAKGIRYAADNGAKVINLSLGGRASQAVEDAVNYAWNQGALLAAAAGNDGGGRKYYPASYPVVISVAATDYDDNTASFSNFNDEIDVSAPGVNVFSTFPTYTFTIGTKYGRSQNYDVGSGTSMSVPHIVGLAGLLFAQDSNRTNNDVRNIIEITTDDLGSQGWDKHFGWGRINVYAALSYTPCVLDTDCNLGEICCSGECIVPTCTESGGECDDGETCTTDTCINPGTCQAYCENVWPTCDFSTSDGCCGPECTSDNDIDCPVDSCSSCFKGVCDGRCHPVKEDATCPDCL